MEFLAEVPRALWVSFYHSARGGFVKNSTGGETVWRKVEPSIKASLKVHLFGFACPKTFGIGRTNLVYSQEKNDKEHKTFQ